MIRIELNEIGLKILNQELKWNDALKSVESKFKVLFSEYNPVTPELLSNYSVRFSKSKSFLNFNIVEIISDEANGFDFSLGFNENEELTDFSSVWNFEVKINDVILTYGSEFSQVISDLKGNNLTLIDCSFGAKLVQEYNIIIAKSSDDGENWNSGVLLEYIFIQK